MLFGKLPTPVIEIFDPVFKRCGVRVLVKRDDLVHEQVQGNKWRKLKYNLLRAKELGYKRIVTFGGAYSNHVYAVSAAGWLLGFETVAIIRGEERPFNHVLSKAVAFGMKLEYLSRREYRRKDSPEALRLLERYSPCYVLPEGGTNHLAVEGVSELIAELNFDYDYICCACGTGGTLAGLVSGLAGRRYCIGVSVLKGGGFLLDEVRRFTSHDNYCVLLDYHFGGYAKTKPPLQNFIEEFVFRHGIPLEPVYTGKLFYAVYDLVRQGAFKRGSTIVLLHTGGILRRGDPLEARSVALCPA
ncbi:MAG: pyridoxal-phosphate dependent enzyme [Acidobacteriota bacterium]|nr:pyridoxal-phosphate dependent enzyme [Blastocatellia bacterium]MDW8412023.1 pyridoxal-phosphate dependent enzyme [Acidobacteriota bacterium]